MYWTDPLLSVIQRADLGGSGVETLVQDAPSRFEPINIALDLSRGKMYWTTNDKHKIQRANLDGSGVEDVLTGLLNPWGIALDPSASKMYWTACCNSDTPPNDRIRRANLDGSGAEDLVTDLFNPEGIALDLAGGKMYWTRQGGSEVKVQRANLDGSAVEDLVTGLPSEEGIALDVAGGVMYWADQMTGRVRRASLNGSGVEDVVTGVSPLSVQFLAPLRLAGCHLVDLKHFVDSCEPCSPLVKESLQHKIVGAIRQVDKGHSRPAANALSDFVKEAARFIERGQLPPDEGRRLIRLAEEIIGEL